MQKSIPIIVKYHSNSKEYTVHYSKNGGAIFFTKNKKTLENTLQKYYGISHLDHANIEYVQH